MHNHILASVVLCSTPLFAQAADLQSSRHVIDIDSGYVQNTLAAPAAIGVPQVVWSTVVTVGGASWLRLEYDYVLLSGSPDRGSDGSFLRLTSMRDGSVQTQHRKHVGEWESTSAYFNGESVMVELVAHPGTGNNRFVLKAAVAGPQVPVEEDDICGAADNRVLSSDPRVARLVNLGTCTAFLINDCNKCFLSAGHCGVTGGSVVQFNVPLSSNTGFPSFPPASDQYAVDPASIQVNPGGAGGAAVGNDWAYFGCFDNSTTGVAPYGAVGGAFDFVNPPAVTGQSIRITGYGVTSAPVSPTWNLAQKTHTGPYVYRTTNHLGFTVDATPGNSGGPVMLEGTNSAIGIVTHSACSSAGYNIGLASTNADLQAALANPLGVCAYTGVCVGGGPVLSTTFASNNGGAIGGAVYFSLEALAGSGGVTIGAFDLNCNSSTIGNPVSIDVYLQPNNGTCSYSSTGVWTLKASGSGVNAGTNNPTRFNLNTQLEIGEGCCVGVAIVANGFGHRYTTGASNPQLYSNVELRLTAGAASYPPFGNNAAQPRVVNTNIHYVLGGTCSDTAVATSYGSGCVEAFTSFYEVLTQAGMDLSGQEIWGATTAGGHRVNTRPATILPVGTLGAATALALGDDDQVPAGTLGLSVGSNGWVARGAGNSNGPTPDVPTMLANPAEGYYAWTDLQPNAAGSGLVYYEEFFTQWMVTYDGVYLANTTDPVTIQFRGNEANGDFTIAFGALGNTGPEDWLVGHSGAGTSADPGARDLSQTTSAGFLMADADGDALELAAVNTPVLGGSFQLQTTNIPSTAVFHCGILGLSQLSLPLASAFPSANLDCNLNASVDLVVGPQVVWGGPGSLTWTGVDLSSVSLLGTNLYFQAATLDLGGLGDTVRTSNGVEATTGLY